MYDPQFAMAHLFRAFAQPAASGFFEDLKKPVSLAEKVSDGERLWILGVDAEANGLPMKQREYYQQLVSAFPDDERAHNLLGNHYFAQQEYAKANAAYQKAIAIDPDSDWRRPTKERVMQRRPANSTSERRTSTG